MKALSHRSGFTIVELLIVVVVIAILAAITIVAFSGINDRARLSSASSTIAQAQRQIAAWRADNADTLPANLSQVPNFAAGSWQYYRFDANQQYCVSTEINGVSYYRTTLASSRVERGSCGSESNIPGAGPALARVDQSTMTSSLASPLVGTPDITMYTVFNVIDTSSGWERTVGLQPSSSGTHVIQLDMSGPDGSAARYRMDSPASTNQSASKGGVRTPGRHIGWLRVADNATERTFNYDGANAHNIASFNPGIGWNFTQLGLGSPSSGTQPIAGLVFNAAHDEQTRARVMQWLAQTYNVPATY